MANRRRIWLIVPFWLWFIADIALTLTGQPHEYWAGDYALAIEFNPLAFLILAHGPRFFAGMAAGWAILLGLLTLCCKHWLVNWLVVAAAVVHAIGGCSWLIRFGELGWVLAAGYVFVASEISWWCWRRTKSF